jgi:hypothetical protein
MKNGDEDGEGGEEDNGAPDMISVAYESVLERYKAGGVALDRRLIVAQSRVGRRRGDCEGGCH